MTTKIALIVDDSPTATELLARVLVQHGLEVCTAGSAEEALEYLLEHRPDVIFMDHMMPGMDGFEALRAIKDNPATATIPIMMYTSHVLLYIPLLHDMNNFSCFYSFKPHALFM